MANSDQQFKEQGGIATMDPSFIRRWLISKLMSVQASEKRMLAKREKAERQRIKTGRRHVVEYFHQVDDGYSHLTSQVLESLVAHYDIALDVHLVSAPSGHNVAEPSLLSNLGLSDAKVIAPHYGLAFPDVDTLPKEQDIALALAILAGQTATGFLKRINAIGKALWLGDEEALSQCASEFGMADQQTVANALAQGNRRRQQLKHYSSAMFYYEGEWYWGIDRLYHLEERLQALGLDKKPQQPSIAKPPEIEVGEVQDKGKLTLEIYASLRSPYTAIVFDRAVKLAKDTGVNYVIRPVLPMVMRGVPATKEKGLYILFDTAREARANEVPYGNVCDPIGQPARHGYALYHWACKFGKGTELFSNFLSAAFAEGVNTNTNRGLQYVVEKSGLDWQQARQHLQDTDWQTVLEDNRLTMYDSGLWGVPSFRLLDQQGREVAALWGQDRLWLIAREIQRLLSLD